MSSPPASLCPYHEIKWFCWGGGGAVTGLQASSTDTQSEAPPPQGRSALRTQSPPTPKWGHNQDQGDRSTTENNREHDFSHTHCWGMAEAWTRKQNTGISYIVISEKQQIVFQL